VPRNHMTLCRTAHVEMCPRHERGRNPGGVAGRFCASWLRFSEKVPSKSLIA